MKKLVYLIICVAFISCTENNSGEVKSKSATVGAKADPTSGTSQKDVEAVPGSVAEIKVAYTNLVKQLANKELDSVVKHYDCAAEISGTVTYYYQKGKLRMLQHEYIEHDHFSAKDQYYVVDEQLFFVYLNSLVWSFESNGAAEGATKDDITEERVYVVDGKPVECLEKKFTIRSKASKNPSSATTPNRKVACKPISPVLKDFDSLIAFKNQGKEECMPK